MNNIQSCILFGVEAIKFIFNIDLILLNVSHLQNLSCVESVKTIWNLFPDLCKGWMDFIEGGCYC